MRCSPAKAQDGQKWTRVLLWQAYRHTGIDMSVSPRNSRFFGHGHVPSHPFHQLTFHTGSHLMRQQVHRGSIDCQDTATGQQVSVARVLTLGRWSCIDQHRRLPYRANSIDSIDSIGSSETACLTLLPLFDHYTVGSRQLVRG
ncbi:hypothetical protein GMDG_01278 [Pseudogymnoascus destructans 20631-21]|uniref:Uncharacterized protein n=1 Tax=Pseudogymnoascus destructans (strain ATCC MYA-4855 / 20631-21) TaxID=658429 RepID=L8FRK6_PSED2|nr:hypothetical protein GMDG_01278 [Pseudogymnoascus destructans 20631-21]